MAVDEEQKFRRGLSHSHRNRIAFQTLKFC
jgi:hypothetical protein